MLLFEIFCTKTKKNVLTYFIIDFFELVYCFEFLFLLFLPDFLVFFAIMPSDRDYLIFLLAFLIDSILVGQILGLCFYIMIEILLSTFF